VPIFIDRGAPLYAGGHATAAAEQRLQNVVLAIRAGVVWRKNSHLRDSQRRPTMSKQWEYQVRIYLDEDLAQVARHDPDDPAIRPLADILTRHHAAMKCQFDAFADYVTEAEQRGTENYPLYAWTKATIENPEKKAKYLKSFTLYVDGNEVYAKPLADALESDLQPLISRRLITRLSKHDTNPANNPQPPAQYRR
jgi:hypothetical protein